MNPCIPHHKVVRVARASIISESEVSFTILCLLCSPRYTAVRIKNCSKSTSVIKVPTTRNMMVPRAPVIVWNRSIHCPSLAAMFDLLHSSTNQKVFEKHLCIKNSHYEKFLVTQRKPSCTVRACATTKLTHFTVSKDEWNTKQDTGKSLKNALHILRYTKRHLLGWSNVEQWKSQAGSLAIIELRWSEGIRQLVSQLLENSVK